MTHEIQTTIVVTEEQIEQLVRKALTEQTWDDDLEDYRTKPIDLDVMVRKQVEAIVDDAVGRSVVSITQEIIEARVHKILDEGFPTITEWGSRQGPNRTLREIVGKSVFKQDSYNHGLDQMVRSKMNSCVESIVREHVKGLSKDIGESMKAAAAEALSKWMKSTLGVR